MLRASGRNKNGEIAWPAHRRLHWVPRGSGLMRDNATSALRQGHVLVTISHPSVTATRSTMISMSPTLPWAVGVTNAALPFLAIYGFNYFADVCSNLCRLTTVSLVPHHHLLSTHAVCQRCSFKLHVRTRKMVSHALQTSDIVPFTFNVARVAEPSNSRLKHVV